MRIKSPVTFGQQAALSLTSFDGHGCKPGRKGRALLLEAQQVQRAQRAEGQQRTSAHWKHRGKQKTTEAKQRGFPGAQVVRNSTSKTGSVASIPVQGAKTPHAT